MDINLRQRIEDAKRDLERLSVWLEGRGEVEVALAIQSIEKIVDALVEEANFLERLVLQLEGEVNGDREDER